MSILQLMADKTAGAYYLAIKADADPLWLADQYKLAKLANEKSYMLALEHHLRDAARIHFHKNNVLKALQEMEKTKSARKFGKGAGKDLQYIADEIERKYTAGECEYLDLGEKVKFTISPKSGGCLKVTCQNRPGAVAWTAAKYRRGIGKSRAARYGTSNA
jgi:hypothetical protein